jgi:spore germination protein GerM
MLTAGLAVSLAACGLPGEGDLEEIDPADLVGLDQTTTTSSTTSTTGAPTTTLGSAPIETTTTIATEQVTLYYLAGSQLVPVTQTLTRPASLQQVLLALEAGPPSGDLGVGLESLLPAGLTNQVTEVGGVATVDLNDEVFADIADADQRAAIAQIVLTLTERPGVGQVRFTLDDGTAELQVPKRGGELSQPGEAVSELDFETLIDQAELPPETTGVTSTTGDTSESTTAG